ELSKENGHKCFPQKRCVPEWEGSRKEGRSPAHVLEIACVARRRPPEWQGASACQRPPRMFRIRLPADTSLLLAPQWSGLPPALQIVLLVLLAVVPLALVVALYRYELKLVPPRLALLPLPLR